MNAPYAIKKYLTAVLCCAICLLASFNEGVSLLNTENQEVRWKVLPNSSINIKGSSNVNTFGCKAGGAISADMLHATMAKDKKSVTMKGAVSININQFDCKNRMLTNDLRKTLQADKYPEMKIHFLSLERMPLASEGEDFLSGHVLIELAGQKKKFHLRYAFQRTQAGTTTLSGSRTFSFSDFDLTPPKKVGGLVKVNDDFDVSFTLVLHTP